MDKLLFSRIIVGIAIILAVIVGLGCVMNRLSNDNYNGEFTLQETPQRNVLSGGNSFETMPTVILYQNGNAKLSQPLISSYALIGIGHYKVNGDELVVSYEDNKGVTFTISNGGNTLTVKSVNLGFVKVGDTYKYQSNSDYLNIGSKVDGEILTLDILRELSKKGADLTADDFIKYTHVDIDPDYHVFDIEGEYMLTVINDTNGNMTCTLECNSSGDIFPLHLNGSTGYVLEDYLGFSITPKYQPCEWVDYYSKAEMPWGKSNDLTLPYFPDVTFTWTAGEVMAGDQKFIIGIPVWNVYLADLTNDGIPEFCATVSMGFGAIDTHIVVYDYANDKQYVLEDRMYYDYYLSLQDGRLMVTQTKYNSNKPLVSGELLIINGELYRFGEPTLKDLPDDYGTYDKKNDAIRDGVYINVHGVEIYNQQVVDDFYKSVHAGSAAFMRTIDYTDEGDPIITDYQYDGSLFTVTTDTTRDRFGLPDIYTKTYNFLIPYDHYEPAGIPIPYFLSNDKNIYKGTQGSEGVELKSELGRIPSPSDDVENP
ncbi:DUF4362 domain-containing protein [Lachnoclostridium sp.]|uniref:DUF4362 domain-containing protein n=1 Tax=Lachnoclostridium sp. TaxID=2028282 RepID=UPI0028978737|nr:DUF4362 domain-containing protein [Lachnoclostridium sp.]